MSTTRPSWESPTASLVISSPDLAPDAVSAALGLQPTHTHLPHERPQFREGAGCWAHTPAAAHGDVSQQLLVLAELLAPRREALDALQAEGHRVEIEVTGGVETGRQLLLSPAALTATSSLRVPLTFTAVSLTPPEPNPFDWMPTGTHRG